jgi:hypothetical protein
MSKEMVHVTIPCYNTGEELRIGKWKLDSSCWGIIFVPRDNPNNVHHYYYNEQTRHFEAHIKDNHTKRKQPLKTTFGETLDKRISEALSEDGVKSGKLPYGFIRQVSGTRYPPKCV